MSWILSEDRDALMARADTGVGRRHALTITYARPIERVARKDEPCLAIRTLED